MIEFSKIQIGKEDRVSINKYLDFIVLTVADGAGGVGGAAEAAELFLLQVNDFFLINKEIISLEILKDLFFDLDLMISNDFNAGEVSGAVVIIKDNIIYGVSIGDCELWTVDDYEINILTVNQFRKPLIGSKLAIPISFEGNLEGKTLILGTDGLFNYINRTDLAQVNNIDNADECIKYLLDKLKLKENVLKYCDDIGIIVGKYIKGGQI